MLVIGWIGVAGLIFIALRFFRAAYGRYVEQSRAPLVSARLGWVLMESVSLLGFSCYFFFSDRLSHAPSVIFFSMWAVHYVHRSWIYPFRAQAAGRKMPISIVAMGIVFNAINASINGYWLFHLGPAAESSWFGDPRFIIGVLLFGLGMALNISSDNRLLALRRSNGADYKIPEGGLFRWVSCPNYLGEIIEWCGWAIATWSLAGLSFAAWSFGNLAPRALSHHGWYCETFNDYPRERKALFPFII